MCLLSSIGFQKSPENLILMDSYQLELKAFRALQALRLSGPGSVSIGFLWPIRAAHFNVGLSGLHRSGFSIPAIGGDRYLWTEGIAQTYPVVYSALSQLERNQYRNAPVALDVALRAFGGTYDRYPLYRDSQLVDAITALEALVIKSNRSYRRDPRVFASLPPLHRAPNVRFVPLALWYSVHGWGDGAGCRDKFLLPGDIVASETPHGGLSSRASMQPITADNVHFEKRLRGFVKYSPGL